MDETINLMRILPADTAIQFIKIEGSRMSNRQAEAQYTSVLIYSKYDDISNVKRRLTEVSPVRHMC